MKYTEEQAKEMYTKAVALGLDGAEKLANAEIVTNNCNGVGADWMPESLCNLCTKLHRYMEIPSLIHDLEYKQGGTEEQRAEADNRFYQNTCKVIDSEYGWYNPLRYTKRHKAKEYYRLLQIFGSKAWNYTETESDK